MLDLTHLLSLPRPALAENLARHFPDAATDPGAVAAATALWAHGGRSAAIERLDAVDPEAYGKTRNHVAGAVTRLSPWLRHGVLSLAEVRDAALARVGRPEDAAKLIAELGWRDYWRRVHATLGSRIRDGIEPPARKSRAAPGPPRVPADVAAAATGMACIDAFVARLRDTGWLHNHERMWLASWMVHVRGIRWRDGADWMLSRLIDGDPASNHLSWQWIAGTFAAKPYLFNRENLEAHTSGIHCRACPVLGRCDVEGSYESLDARLFLPAAADRPPLRIPPAADWPGREPPALRRPLVWLTLDSASAAGPALHAFPDACRLFVVDPEWLAEERPSLCRLLFLFECLGDVPGARVVLADPAVALPECARQNGCDGVAVAETPCPRTRRVAARLGAGEAAESPSLPVAVVRWPVFCDAGRVRDLGRFSRFWQQAAASAMRPTAC